MHKVMQFWPVIFLMQLEIKNEDHLIVTIVLNDIIFTDDNLYLDNNVNIVNCNSMNFN